jgi:crossover junction endodeoxyribonuclease RuvC
MIILGIDPGSAVTGFGIIETNANKLRMLDFGVIRTNRNHTLPSKLKTIYDGVAEVIETYKPDQMAVEDIFYSENVKTALVIGHARGVAILAAINRQIPVSEYSPREVKQSVVGNGAADKSQVGYMVKKILSLKGIPKPDDASDALGVAICHFNRTGLEKRLGVKK